MFRFVSVELDVFSNFTFWPFTLTVKVPVRSPVGIDTTAESVVPLESAVWKVTAWGRCAVGVSTPNS